MRTIRKKLLLLFAAQTAVILLAVLILYNIAVSFYFDSTARRELKGTFSTMNLLVEKQLMEPASTQGESGGDTALMSLSAALTASRLSGRTEFFIFDGEFQTLFPKDVSGTLLTDALLSQIKDMDFDGQPGEIYKTEGCYVSGMPFEKLEGLKLYIVFAADTSGSGELIRAMNLMLAAVMGVSLLLGLLLAGKGADGISRPIRKACEYASEIGNGNFIPVPPDGSSLEISRLCAGMNDMSLRLKQPAEAQKLFFQNASHELRTPLMSIQGYAEAIGSGIAEDPKEAAAVIRKESIRLTALVGELLTLSRLDAEGYEVRRESIDLNEFLAENVYRLEGLAIREHKKLLLNPGPGGVFAAADEQLFSQAIANTVSNCLRYACAGVELSLARKNGQAVITVADDGPGFDQAALPHLFDRFFKGEGGNFGLGLAIAKKSMELMGGSITARNGETGAVFELRLPVLPAN